MPPKKKIKKKQELKAEPEYKLLNLEEMKTKKQKYFNRLRDLKVCSTFIDDALSEVNRHSQQEWLENKWLDFSTCNPLPKPYVPTDIRRFYSKLNYMEKENIDKTLNWLLMVNETSILSQDIYRQDLTRRKLNATVREKFDEEYKSYIRDSLEILNNIDKFLDNDSEVAKCRIVVLHDIVKRKMAIENDIMDFIDRLTYRIISSENSEMKSIDAISAEYFSNGPDFDIHIWCIKNVPVRFSHLGEPRVIADFHAINLLLQIPLNMLRENLGIRALHLNFDLLSEKSKTFKQLIPSSYENPTVGLLDLHDCLVSEWTLQMELQAQVLAKLKANRLEYEEKKRLYDEYMENMKSQRNVNRKIEKPKKILKPSFEPPFIADDSFPDIFEDFLQEEQIQNENFIQTTYNPELLNLTLYEINLRKYFILGGIYQVDYVEKPQHIDLNGLNMTWHHDEAKLIVDKNMKITRGSLLSRQSQMEQYRRLTRRMTVFEAETRLADANIESPWFIVTIQLPEYFCFWAEPTACHFEETLRKVEIIPRTESVSATKEKTTTNHKEEIMKLPAVSSTQRADDDLFQPANTDLQKRKTFFQDSLANSLLNKSKIQPLSNNMTKSVYVKDFSLQETLTKPQIRHIERHIIPRIISSYKLPIEALNEEELQKKEPQTKGGKLFSQKNKDFPITSNTRHFTFSDIQNNPERIFVKYPDVHTLQILSFIKTFKLMDFQKEPETFAELLHVVDDIKRKYQLIKNKMDNVMPIEREITTRNRRIKKMLKTMKKQKVVDVTNSQSTILQPVKFANESLNIEINESSQIKSVSESQTDLSMGENSLSAKTGSVVFNTKKTESEHQTYLQWTTEYIFKSEFDRETRKIMLQTDRLGNFGFAFKRYEHFPFKYWNMEPNANNPDNEVVFTLGTQHAKYVLYIAASGIRGHVSEPTKSYVRKPKIYLSIENPIKDFKEFKKLLQRRNLNIFAEYDAGFYIEKGNYCEKHLSTELHTYQCMAVHCTQMRFYYSHWNRLAKRRDIILRFNHYKDMDENLVDVRITPGEAFFVEIQESCSHDLNVINLDYKLTWRNIVSCSDLHHLIISMHPTATDLRCKNPKLICFIRDLLSEVRLLSFS